jgi:hypothetical protein
MRRVAALPILLVLSLAAGRAGAEEAVPVCNALTDLMAPGAEPKLQAVSLDRERARFVKDGTEQQGCPKDTASCAAKRYLVADDRVIVSSTTGAYACATFTGYAPTFPTSSGFLPLAALTDVLARPSTDWRGAWRSGDEQQIEIKPAAGGALALEGYASFGGDDPERVARGAVNVGQFSATVTPAAGKAAFSLDLDGKVLPFDASPEDDSACRVRLWRLGPYLVAADNLRCGGMNVTFTGVSAREKTAK